MPKGYESWFFLKKIHETHSQITILKEKEKGDESWFFSHTLPKGRLVLEILPLIRRVILEIYS